MIFLEWTFSQIKVTINLSIFYLLVKDWNWHRLFHYRFIWSIFPNPTHEVLFCPFMFTSEHCNICIILGLCIKLRKKIPLKDIRLPLDSPLIEKLVYIEVHVKWFIIVFQGQQHVEIDKLTHYTNCKGNIWSGCC